MHIPDSLVASLRGARHVLVFTGAGVSAESGIPTFRDALSGLWVWAPARMCLELAGLKMLSA